MPNTYCTESKLRARIVYALRRLAGHEIVKLVRGGRANFLYRVEWSS